MANTSPRTTAIELVSRRMRCQFRSETMAAVKARTFRQFASEHLSCIAHENATVAAYAAELMEKQPVAFTRFASALMNHVLGNLG